MKRYLLIGLLAFLLPLQATELHKYGTAATIYFALVDPAGVDFETSATCAQGGGAGDDDVQISKDGGAMTDSTNCFASEGNGIYSLQLTSTEMEAAVVAVTVVDQTATKVWMDHAVIIQTYGNASAKHAIDLDSEGFRQSQGTIVTGTVDDTNFSPTSTQFEADDITEATANHFVSRVIIFTSGSLQYQAAKITSYSLASGRGHFTVSGMTEAPSNNDTFIIL